MSMKGGGREQKINITKDNEDDKTFDIKLLKISYKFYVIQLKISTLTIEREKHRHT